MKGEREWHKNEKGLGLHQDFLYPRVQNGVIRVGLERKTTFTPTLG